MEVAEIIDGLLAEIAQGDYMISEKEKLLDAALILSTGGVR